MRLLQNNKNDARHVLYALHIYLIYFFCISALFGFISVIMFGSAMTSLQYSLNWSCAFVIIGLIVDIAAGICIYIGGQQWEEALKVQRKRELFPPIKSSRLDPRLEQRIQAANQKGSSKSSGKLFNPKASPQLGRKFRFQILLNIGETKIFGSETSFSKTSNGAYLFWLHICYKTVLLMYIMTDVMF